MNPLGLKNILIITKLEKCKLCSPIAELLSKYGYKVFLSNCKKEEIKKAIFDHLIEIIILMPAVELSYRFQICEWLFKNYPNKVYISYTPFSLQKELDIIKCPLYLKHKCRASFLIFDVFTQKELLVKRIEYLIHLQYTNKIANISFKLLNMLDEAVKNFGVLPLFKKEVSVYSSYNRMAQQVEQLINFIGEKLVDFISKKFLADKISLFMYDVVSNKYVLVASKNYKIEDKNKPLYISEEWKFVNMAIKNKKNLILQDGEMRYPVFKKLNFKPQPDIISSLVMPIVVGENVLGVLNVARLKEDKERYTSVDLSLLVYLTGWIGYIYSIIMSFKLNIEYNKLKDDFIAIINHELRTPLMALSASFELLEGKIPKNIEEIVKRNIKRLTSMIEELLDFSRIFRGKLKVVKKENSILKLINEIVEEYSQQLKNKGIEFIVDTDIKTAEFNFDYYRIKQVLTNFINNSIKFFPEDRENKYIKLSVKEKEKVFEFCVEDNGKGIPKSELKKVFLPFVQVGDVSVDHKQGLGLGLAIAKEIAKQHKGRIFLESQEGSWTKACLILPKK